MLNVMEKREATDKICLSPLFLLTTIAAQVTFWDMITQYFFLKISLRLPQGHELSCRDTKTPEHGGASTLPTVDRQDSIPRVMAVTYQAAALEVTPWP